MGILYTEKENIILPKEITIVPYSNEVDYITFSKLLDNMSATYKMYWLLGIINEVAEGNVEIEFRKLISRMIVAAWYPIRAFKLNFGMFDKLGEAVDYIATTYNFENNCDEKKLMKFIYESDDKELNKKIKNLTNQVPYKLLSPFFEEKVKGISHNERLIEELSREDKRCIYEIYVNEKNEKSIRIRENWINYLKYNYRILKGWIYYELVIFLQKRNVNVPAIAMKLDSPKSRNLTSIISKRKLWKNIVKEKNIIDLYTGLDFTEENYEEKGVFSIDHFIPWSFVLHDQMWNLVPTFKNINCKKSDNLLSYDLYIEDFCKIQYDAFSFVVDKQKSTIIEEYRDVLKFSDAVTFKNEVSKEEFIKRIKQEIYPTYNIASNQGFRVLENFL